jgi:hypothetical protein
MAFAVAARQSATNAETDAGNLVTASATPTADSLYLVAFGAQMNAFGTETLPVFATPTGGSLTYTLVDKHGDVTPGFLWGTSNGYWTGGAVYRAPIGGSPSAFAVTVDGAGGATTAYHSAVCLDITGHNVSSPIVQTARNGAGINPESSTASGTVTFASAPTSGNLIVVAFMQGVDAAGGVTSPTAGVGKTFTAVTAQTTRFCTAAVFYRVADGTESTTITTTDLGETVGNYVAIAFEVEAAGGGGSNFTQSPVDAEGLTDTASVGLTKALSADLLGLSDLSTSFNFGSAVTNALGLSDSALVEKVLDQASTDNLGLTDSVTAALGRALSDNLGLTDSIALAADHAVADSMGLTDSVQVSASGAGSVTPADTLGVTDAQAIDQGHAYSDSLGLTDATALAKGQTTADSLGLTDTSSLVFIRAQVPADTEALTDSAQVSLTGAGAVTAADNLGVTDGLVVDQGHGYSDTAGLTDAAVRLLDAVRSIIDNAALTDSVQVLLAVPPTSGTAHAASGQAPSASAAAMTVPTATGG